jgi:two-component system chemotaxis sensor kinase CheA
MSDTQNTNGELLVRRAEAAERTVEVLKRKVVELYNGGSQSDLHRQLEKARKRDENNRRKRELVEVRAAELKKYSETLEAEVARRTEAIKTILDNVTFGFLVVNRELTVQPECTKSCYRLFETSKVEGVNLCDLLGLADRARLTFVLSIDQVFEDVLPPEASIAQMRRKFAMHSGRVLQIDAGVVRATSGDVSSLLLTISDITALEAATRESNNNRTLVSILKQRESFRAFVLEAKQQLEAARKAIQGGSPAIARHALHTIKGNSASYGLEDIVQLVHEIEDSVELKTTDVDRVGSALRSFLQGNERVLEMSYDAVGEEGFAVSREQMSDLRTLISSLGELGDSHAAGLRRWTAGLLRKPAWQVLGPIDDFAQKLALRLGKNVTVEMCGSDTTVDVETVRPVFQVLTHLIRNAIDHGIEGPLDRKGKPLTGRLQLELSDQPNAYVVRCTDDGRGVDTEALGRRAIAMGLLTRESVASMGEKELLDLVFVDGLSTAPVTTSISGRGVGMSAVRTAVEKVSGKVEIRSRRGEGTTFSLTIPKHDENTGATGAAARS